jgi:heterodisulfide reductase subunit C
MTIRIKKTGTDSLMAEVIERSGVDLAACLQCHKCSSGCPAMNIAKTAPSALIRRLQTGARNELLKADLIWLCLSCGTCQARCPMTINFPAVIDVLREMAVERNAPAPKGDMPRFNREFLRTVRGHGRAYDLSAIAGYKVGTMNLLGDTGKFPMMLIKGKIALLPPSGADKKAVQRIFSAAKKEKEAGK